MKTTVKDTLDKLRHAYPLPETGGVWKTLRESPEFFDTLLEAVSDRLSIRQFCKAANLSYGTVQAWLRDGLNEDQKKRYELARQVRAASYAEEIEDLLNDLKHERRTAQDTKVMVDSLMKMAKVMDPHIWGDRLQVRTETKTTVEMHLEGVMELAQKIRDGDFTGQVIEGEVEPKLMPVQRSPEHEDLMK